MPNTIFTPLYSIKRASEASARPAYFAFLTSLYRHNSVQATASAADESPTETTCEIAGIAPQESALQPYPSYQDVVVDSTYGLSDEVPPGISSSEVIGPLVGNRDARKQVLQRWIGRRSISRIARLKFPVEVFKVLEALPKGSLLSVEQEKVVLDLLSSERHPPRQMLTFIGTGLRNVPQEKAVPFKSWGYLVLPVLRSAWNDGQDDSDPEAGLVLLWGRNFDVKPAEHLVSLSEASAIAEILGSRWPELTPQARFHLSMRAFHDSGFEEEDAFQSGILAFLHQEWEETKSTLAGYGLARMYLKGYIVPRDTEIGNMWILRVAEQGDPRTALEVGMTYSGWKSRFTPSRVPISFPINHAEARRFLEIACKGGLGFNRLAQYYYLDPTSPFPTAEEHRAHWGVDPDNQRAMDLFERGREQHGSFAQRKLAEMKKALNHGPDRVVEEADLLPRKAGQNAKKRQKRKLAVSANKLADSATAAAIQEHGESSESQSQASAMTSNPTDLSSPTTKSAIILSDQARSDLSKITAAVTKAEKRPWRLMRKVLKVVGRTDIPPTST